MEMESNKKMLNIRFMKKLEKLFRYKREKGVNVMAVLSSNDIDILWEQLMEEFSGVHTEIPIDKNQFRQLLVLIDSQLETAEGTIVSALPTGAAKTWLVSNQSIGRLFIERVERKRKETL